MDKSNSPGFFGEWVKRRRKALDLTQEELAQRAGCSKFALRKIESGERRPSKQLAELLAESLEISSEEKQTFIRVARGETNLERLRAPSLDSSFAPIPDTSALLRASFQPASVPHRIPLQPTPLLGRDSELAAMERLLNESQCRLLTLTGVGGIGKTRLAIEFATRQLSVFPGGIYYVPLASIKSADAIVPGIAAVIGFIFSGPNDPMEQLINHIAVQMNRPVLLVLDNLEHLLVQPATKEKMGAVELISEFLQRLPNVMILATSRERLNLQGEWVYELHGLPTPPPDCFGGLDEYSATALFIQRAQRIKIDFELSESEKNELVQICRLVEGIPLAIELAAAWAGMLTCEEIAREIESNIDFLSTSMRDVPERHRSLRATFDHSWKLLSAEERDVLSRLSVFRGGFDRNAGEKVAGAALPLLASLVSKSLVRHTEKGRYDLHEVIRQYASSRLDEDETRSLETCDRHSEHYLNSVSHHEQKLKSASQQAAMRDMTIETDNLRTAWNWGIKRSKYESVVKAVRSFGWFFEIAGLLYDGIDQLELLVQALSGKSRDIQMDRALGIAFMQQGLLYFRSGHFMRAQEIYQESIAILRTVGEQALLADALIFKGIIMHLNGDYLEAKEMIKEGLACAQAANDQWFTAYGIYGLGHVDSLMGEYQKGYEQMKEGLKIWRTVGDPHAITLGLNFLVETQIKLGRYEEAIASMRESIALCEQTKNRWGMGTAYRYLGLATMAEGQCAEAQGYFQKSLETFGEYFEGWDIAVSLIYLGDATLLSGDLVEAEKIYLRALRLAKEAQSLPLMLDALMGLALFHMRSGKNEQAWGLSNIVLNDASSVQETKDRARQLLSEVEGQLSAEQIQTIKQRASKQSLETIVNMLIPL